MNLEKLINNGPAEFETSLEMMLKGKLTTSEPKKKFIEFADFLNTQSRDKKESKLQPFLTAYFSQKAGTHCSDQNERNNLFEKSLNCYQAFQDNGDISKIDLRYFSQWQIGILQQALKKSWFLAEESLLKAMVYDPRRGESIREIIITYSRNKDWRIANIYSSYCVENLLGKVPVNGKWHIDLPFYRWKILKYHVIILVNLNRMEQANECAKELFERAVSYKDLGASEKNEISELRQSWKEIL
jgi:hypothetical protein